MEAAINAARWVLGMALSPVTDGLLEAWASSAGLGPNFEALKMELLYAQAMLKSTRGTVIDNPALKELLLRLRELAYNADDVLDELEYFRIQDELEGTHETTDDVHDKGCVQGLLFNARHTARAVCGKLKVSCSSGEGTSDGIDKQEGDATQGCPFSALCSCGFCSSRKRQQGRPTKQARRRPSPSPLLHGETNVEVAGGCMSKVAASARSTAHAFGKLFPCSSSCSSFGEVGSSSCSSEEQHEENDIEIPKLKFDRVDISRKMKDIVEQLKPICAKVSTILNLELLGSQHRTTMKDTAMGRPETNPIIVEQKLYGRDREKDSIINAITQGAYFTNELTVLPIVGPGGIGKTAFTQHVYDAVKSHFHVSAWICVSFNFSTNRLAKEVVNKIPKSEGENDNISDHERIVQRLIGKRFLLVLDDMWTCQEDEWQKLLATFEKGGGKGNMVIVTTRIPEVANAVMKTVVSPIEMKRLGHGDFMKLFEECVFGPQGTWEDHPESLREVGEKIASNLKGFPLAAKTVGRLLRKRIALDHWTRVLESKEWESQASNNDILPALKLSYDYLPFHLQQCFSYCGLFPEDYEFDSNELIHLWVGLGIIPSGDQNKRIHEVGLGYLDDLLNHGFFKKNKRDDGRIYYVLHDLLHELALKVSSYECLSISSHNVRSVSIPPSVRHLSINIDDKDVEDRIAYEEYKKDLSALNKRMRSENLRTLILFGEHHGSFVKIFGNLFREAGALRTILLSKASYPVEDLFCNFSKLVHLRYLRINPYPVVDICLPSALVRLYHLQVIDLQDWGEDCFGFAKQISNLMNHMRNLVKLRYFLLSEDVLQFHSGICHVGKLQFLQELRIFKVRKHSKGFELSQLGGLTELGGTLGIYNLENVQAKQEATEAKLEHKNNLHELILEWDPRPSNKDPAQEESVLESLKPHSNLQGLCVRGHGGTNCPAWLGTNVTVKNLESLELHDLSWKSFPPLGEVWLENEPGENRLLRCTLGQGFHNLKRLELIRIQKLRKWVGNGPCQLFALLEVVIIEDCFLLSELPFSRPGCYQAGQQDNMTWFPRLWELMISNCPDLLSLPPIPWTCAPCHVWIDRVSDFYTLNYTKVSRSECSMDIEKKLLWDKLAFQNLTELKELSMKECPPLPLDHLQMLSSLKTIRVKNMDHLFFPDDGEDLGGRNFSVERIEMFGCNINGNELTRALSYFTKLSVLRMSKCENVTRLGVLAEGGTTSLPRCSTNHRVEDAQIAQHQEEPDAIITEDEEIGPSSAGLLLLPPHLQELCIHSGFSGSHLPCVLLNDDDREAGGAVGGLQGLRSLRSLEIRDCPKLLSSYWCSSNSSSRLPFPTSLQFLELHDIQDIETSLPLSNLIYLTELTIAKCEGLIWSLPLSNLTSLTKLIIRGCGDLRGVGLWPLLSQGHLTTLKVNETPNFFLGSDPPQPQEPPSRSTMLRELWTDDVAGVLVAPICTILSSSLTILYLDGGEVERFTDEQDEALGLLTSLQFLGIAEFEKLQCLPRGLRKLPNLKTLRVMSRALQSLPKEGLPSSLQELSLVYCRALRSVPKGSLPSSLQILKITGCPAIRSLPKDALPSSLCELDVRRSNDELIRQCRREFRGTVPIVRP